MMAISETDVRKTLCCPKGCVRADKHDDCFVDGYRHRFTPSCKEIEQAQAILALFKREMLK